MESLQKTLKQFLVIIIMALKMSFYPLSTLVPFKHFSKQNLISNFKVKLASIWKDPEK